MNKKNNKDSNNKNKSECGELGQSFPKKDSGSEVRELTKLQETFKKQFGRDANEIDDEPHMNHSIFDEEYSQSKEALLKRHKTKLSSERLKTIEDPTIPQSHDDED